jgi:hypothetical protein
MDPERRPALGLAAAGPRDLALARTPLTTRRPGLVNRTAHVSGGDTR